MEHENNEQHPITPPSDASSSSIHAPASLIPSVLNRLGRGSASQGTRKGMPLLYDALHGLSHSSIPPGASRDQLLAALHAENESIRVAAIRALATLGKQAPVDQLATALHDVSWNVRATAAYVLGELGAQTPVEPLLAALRDEDESVRTAAVRALGMLGERAPIAHLEAALHDSEWSVRETAALTLGTLGERVPAELLTPIAHNEAEDTSVRDAARWALHQQELDDDIENSTGDETSGAFHRPLQRPVFITPKRHRLQRLTQGVLAVLLIAGIALSWLALAQRLHPSAPGVTPPLIPTISPHPDRKGTILFTYRAQETLDYPVWSPDGKYMSFLTESSGNDSATLHLRNVATGKLTSILSFPHLEAQHWTWESDGVHFLLSQYSNAVEKVQIWDDITGHSIFLWEGPATSQFDYAWSYDGSRIAMTDHHGTVQVWDVLTDRKLLTFTTDAPTPYSVSWSPNGQRIAIFSEHFVSVSPGGVLQVWDANTGHKIATINDPTFVYVLWSPDGRYLVSVNRDTAITHTAITQKVWDATTGKKLVTHPSGGKDLFWMCDDKRLFTDASQQIDVWDAATGNTIYTLPFLGQWQVSPDCKYITLMNGKDVQVVNATTGHLIFTYHGHSTPVLTLGLSYDSTYIASVSQDKIVQVWNTLTGNTIYTYHVTSNAVNGLIWSPNDRLIATTSNDNILQVLQVASL